MPLFNKEYPDSFGAHRASIMTITGPASYAAYTAPSTGGQLVPIEPNSGIKIADIVMNAISRSGLYRVDVVRYEASNVRGMSLARASIRLKWTVLATGAETAGAVNLSAEKVDLFVLGPK